MAKTLEKSVITCDMEGRIETISKGSERIFGYSEDELVGKKRVSIFSPGEVVLENVPKWLENSYQKPFLFTKMVHPFRRASASHPLLKMGHRSATAG